MQSEKMFEGIRLRWFMLWYVSGVTMMFILSDYATKALTSKMYLPLFDVVESYFIYIIPVIWIILKMKKYDFSLNKLMGKFEIKEQWKEIIFVVIISIAFSMGLIIVFSNILIRIAPSVIEEILGEDTLNTGSYSLFYKGLESFNVIILGPIVEELVCRGIILNRLKVKWGVRKALIVSSVIFGIVHFDFGGAFVFGLFMALLYLKTNSLIVPIVCHCLNNGIVTLLTLITDKGNESMNLIFELQSYFTLGMSLLALSIPLVIYYIYKNWPRKNRKPNKAQLY